MERMEEYFVANDITDEAKKRSTLLCNIGSKAYGIVRSLLSPAKPASSTYRYQLIVEKLTAHYHPKPSVTVARFRFFSCYRVPGESIQTFIARLRQLAGDCQFGTFLEEMIRDRLICGVKADRIQSRLLSEPDLSLKKAAEMAVAMETAGRNLQELSGAEAAEPPRQGEVQQIRSQRRSRPTAAGPATQQRANRGTTQQAGTAHHTSKTLEGGKDKCWRCLSNRHEEEDCYFRRKKCFQCFRYGHTSAAHRAGTLNSVGMVPESESHEGAEGGLDTEVETEEADAMVSDLFTCAEERPSPVKPPIKVDVSINGQPVQMELDTGAAVSICTYRHGCRSVSLW